VLINLGDVIQEGFAQMVQEEPDEHSILCTTIHSTEETSKAA
jgi:hypothetical protein